MTTANADRVEEQYRKSAVEMDDAALGPRKSWCDRLDDLDLDAAAACVTEDVIWEDPSMFGVHVNGRAELRPIATSSGQR